MSLVTPSCSAGKCCMGGLSKIVARRLTVGASLLATGCGAEEAVVVDSTTLGASLALAIGRSALGGSAGGGGRLMTGLAFPAVVSCRCKGPTRRCVRACQLAP